MSEIDLLILDFDGVCTAPMRRMLTEEERHAWQRRAESGVSLARSLGTTVVILSNEVREEWTVDFPVLGLVDQVVNCADNGIYKPDRRAFQRCLLLTGKSAERTLVADDNTDNIAVAASLGMQTVHFDGLGFNEPWSAVEGIIA